jgi:hypothetical protein
MDLPPDFSDLLAEFAADSVELLVVGGYAVAFHARPRATKDIDILLRGTPRNLERASRALARFGAPANVVDAVKALGESDVVYLGQPPLRIDILRRIDGVDDSVFDRAVSTTWNGTPVSVIGLDDLIANKRAAARPQDLLDAELLERARLQLTAR